MTAESASHKLQKTLVRPQIIFRFPSFSPLPSHDQSTTQLLGPQPTTTTSRVETRGVGGKKKARKIHQINGRVRCKFKHKSHSPIGKALQPFKISDLSKQLNPPFFFFSPCHSRRLPTLSALSCSFATYLTTPSPPKAGLTE